MKSKVKSRTIKIDGRYTGISVEDEFWNALRDIAKKQHETVPHLVSSINAERQHANLSSAIRLFVLSFNSDQAAKDQVSRSSDD